MGCFKRERWKASIALAGLLLLLVLMVGVPVSEVGAYEGTSGLATPGTGTVQATPTEDATVTALNKEKLSQEIKQLQQSNDRGLGVWLWSNMAGVLSSFLSTLVVVIGALFGLWRWRVDRRDAQDKESKDRQAALDKELEDRNAEREKRAEERFQSAVEGLGSERNEAKIGAAITLRTFLRPGYEQFYTQTFDLTVANLRLPRTLKPPEDPTIPLPLTSLSQALIVVFKEAFPLARDQETRSPQSLDATGIQLDNAYLNEADLKQVWMPQAFLRKAELSGAKLGEARLHEADLRGAKLTGADLHEAGLRGADLRGTGLSKTNLSKADLRTAKLSKANLHEADLRTANFNRADLSEADLSGADLRGADLRYVDLRTANLSRAKLNDAKLSKAKLSTANLYYANLRGTDLSEAKLSTANFNRADLSRAKLNEAKLNAAKLTGADLHEAGLRGADLRGADLRGAKLNAAKLSYADLSAADLSGADLSGADLSGTNLEGTLYLKATRLHDVKGLTKEGLEACKAKGAIIDEDVIVSTSQSTVSPSPSSQNNDVQAQSATPTRGNIPTSDTGGNSATSSQPNPGE